MTPSIQELIIGASGLMSRLPVIIIGFAVVYFFWRLVQILMTSNAQKKEDLRGLIGFGILALFVMMFVWAIVKLFQSSLFPGGFIQTLGS